MKLPPRLVSHLAISALLLLPGTAGAAVLCVNPGGTGGCFATIQAAVDAAGVRDEIDIEPGTYTESVTITEGSRTIRGAGAGSTILQGGIWLRSGGRLDLSDLAVVGNHAVHPASVLLDSFRGGRLRIERCDISGSTESGVLLAEGTLIFVDSISHGHAEAGILAQGRATILRSTLAGNGETGLRIDGGKVDVRQSLVRDNPDGIRVRLRSRLRLLDSTVSGNLNRGIRLDTTVQSEPFAEARGSTVTDNAIGILVSQGRLTLQTSIVAGNTVDDVGASRAVSRGFNVIGTTSTMVGRAALDLTGVADPMLAPLANNGGPTETHALLPGSPALAFVTQPSFCLGVDQRGVPHAPAPCDSGAFEAP